MSEERMHLRPLRSILAASDLSQGSDEALRSAAVLAAAAGAELHIVHGLPLQAQTIWEGGLDEAAREESQCRADAELARQLERVIGDAQTPASRSVRLGAPTREITARAAEVGADLVVVGPHHPRRVLDGLLGSTADRVIRSAAVPCLVAHRPLTLPPRRVLLPTDFSPPARRALEVAVDWFGGPLGAEGGGAPALRLLHVSAISRPAARPIASHALLEREEEAARARPGGGRVTVSASILSAPFAIDGILASAEATRADLIMLGTHGYGMLGRALIGSVASEVARTAPYPVLLVPPPP